MFFYKYQATGNDFIFIDAFDNPDFELSPQDVRFLCDRHFGIGSDGLIILRPSDDYDFFMDYYNPDGTMATFCGNGGRASVLFAFERGRTVRQVWFEARDGIHRAEIKENDVVKLEMKKVRKIKLRDGEYFLNTGTEHTVVFVDDVDKTDVKKEGRRIRYDVKYAPDGTNVNFVQVIDNSQIKVRTYEKGVEDETLSCGTGTVASAIVAEFVGKTSSPVEVVTRGGVLKVYFEKRFERYIDVWLEGEAKFVFSGEIFLPFKEIEKNK